MKRIKLTQNTFALIDNEDFDFLNQWKWRCQINRNGKMYAVRTSYSKEIRKTIYMHKLLIPSFKGYCTDHINGDSLDNQRSNLRIVTKSQDCLNSKLRKDNKSGYRGIYFDNKRHGWIARFMYQGKDVLRKQFKNKEEALLYYREILNNNFGEFFRRYI